MDGIIRGLIFKVSAEKEGKKKMSTQRIDIEGKELENVVGGSFQFNTKTNTMTYTHEDGSVTEHTILDANKAWETSNLMHAKMIPEDEILATLISYGYLGR